MKARIKRILTLFLFSLLLTGCGGEKVPNEPVPVATKAESLSITQYQERIRTLLDEIGALSENVNYEDTDSVTELIGKLKPLYTELSELSAPEKLSAEQETILEICETNLNVLDLSLDILTLDEEKVTADDLQKVEELQKENEKLGTLQASFEATLDKIYSATGE